MPRNSGGYLAATRHPWPCLVFLLPLLVAYEAGVVWLGGARPDAVRNGADAWLRSGLEYFGLTQYYCAPALVVAVLLVWSWLRIWDRPGGVVSLWFGMMVESIIFAAGLWAVSRHFDLFLQGFGIKLSIGLDAKMLRRMVTFVGAGIYEETMFRLLLFFVLKLSLLTLGIPGLVRAVLTVIISSLLFAAAHHVGPYGEAFDSYIFAFRTLAGLYFALLYQLRGFGIAVGAHAGYDVLIGILMF